VVDHVRLFPRLDGQVYWEYRVHEQILPSLQRAGVKIAWSNVVLRHTGYSVPDIRKRKLARDGAILRQELAERPGHPFTLFNMGALAMQDEDWAAALEHINASLRASAPSDSIVNKLYAMAAQCHRMRGEHPLSLAACAKGLETTPDDAELLFRKGLVLRDMGDQAGAEACWRRVLSLQRPNRFGSVDQGIYTHLPRRNLAIVVAERGDRAEARRLWSEVLAECPNDRDTLRALARLDAEESGQAASDPDTGWLMADSCRARLPEPPEDAEGDFTPFAPAAAAWVRALDAKVIVALGVRFGDSARSLLDAAHETEGHVWGVDSVPRHDVADQRFTYLAEDPLPSAGRWERIDLLHVEVDPNTGDLPSRWLDPYKAKCRAIALAGTHHPSFGTSAAARQLAASGDWRAFEYRAGYCGWTVLVRHGEPTPDAKIIGPDAPPMSPPESACCDPRGLYLNLLERTLADAIYDGRNEPIRLQGLDWPQRAHTMIGLRRLRHLRRCVERALADGIPGDLMETGVWRGGAAILMRGALDAYGDSQRRVWAADSFRGVPPPDPERYPVDAGDRHHQARALAVGLDDVKENFRRYGLLDDRVCFLEGWFRDTLPAAPVERLAVLRLDGDLYESTMVALESLYDRVSPGGFVIVDDYGAIAPCRQAVHNFRATRGISEPLRPIDWAAAYWRRAASE
jgi:O-methyltransferase